MQKLIKNQWRRDTGKPFEVAKILNHEFHPEGLDVERVRFLGAGMLTPSSSQAHIVSVLRGRGMLHVAGDSRSPFRLDAGVHLYLPLSLLSTLDMEPGSELLQVTTATASQARGKRLLLRDETFLSACASGAQSLRWILTSQYLSRRIFLYHDPVLLSKSGNPVSWFRTTMFDVTGLHENQDGEPVFKMCYNTRTEFDVCYDVKGNARVRMSQHPYSHKDQLWDPWLQLDNDATYHVNEVVGGPEEAVEITTPCSRLLRNKHEVSIVDGYVTLFCLFDPAPTGIETHVPGEYSDYESLSQVLGTERYATYRHKMMGYDAMLDQLSMAKATGSLSLYYNTPLWRLYQCGLESQLSIESELIGNLVAEGRGRENILMCWRQPECPPELSEKGRTSSPWDMGLWWGGHESPFVNAPH